MYVMARSAFAQKYCEKLFPPATHEIPTTDPEFSEFFQNLAFDEVINEEAAQLPDRERMLVIIATLLGCQGVDLYKEMVSAALEMGVSPVELREVTYQAVAYLGLGRVYPFFAALNQVFEKHNIELPLSGQATTTPETRLAAGNAVQIAYFGEGMRESWKQGPQERAHINRWLADNCFGDYYTRTGLSDKDREMITFCYIAAQGGCEPQLTAHASGNMNLGNDKDFLYRVVSNMLPYIGYPRSLNALTCIDNAADQRA